MNGFEEEKKKKKKKGKDEDEDDEEEEIIEAEIEKEESKSFDMKRARRLASPDARYLAVGALGALMVGSVFPSWGIIFAEMIDMIYRPVFGCQEDFGLPCNITSKVDCEVGSIVTCEKYWNSEADYMKERSFFIGGLWIVMMV